jgi:hypothetical protein
MIFLKLIINIKALLTFSICKWIKFHKNKFRFYISIDGDDFQNSDQVNLHSLNSATSTGQTTVDHEQVNTHKFSFSEYMILIL